jgi:trimeric autotransporter adhesin
MKKKLTLMMAMVITIATGHAQWQLTGNSIGASDFLGSTNAQPLVFKTNNVRAGLIDYDNTKLNTALGYQTLLSNTGTVNTAVGYTALFSNTSGSYNVAFGATALKANTTGGGNSAFGAQSLTFNTSGANNTAVGLSVLFSNTTGNDNVGAGYLTLNANTTGASNSGYGFRALNSNTTGAGNVAVGYQTLYTNSTTSNLTAVGYQSLFNNTSGTGGAAIGYQALKGNTTGTNNTATGYQALFTNTTGFENTAVGYQALYANDQAEWNTALGFSALYFNVNGASNTAVGNRALYSNSGVSADRNTAVGDGALYSNTTGVSNTSIGTQALFNNITGSNNTAIGYLADVNASAYSNTTMVGYQASGTASNQVRVGNSSVTSIGGFQNWSNISDKRFKKNVKEDVPGLEFINRLRPVTYNLDISGIESFLNSSARKDGKGGEVQVTNGDNSAIRLKEQIVYTGFIAQEVEDIAKELGYQFSGVDAAKNDKDLYSLRYAEFVVPLVKAVQQLNTRNEELENQVTALQSQLDDIKLLINNLKSGELSSTAGLPVLRQNAPNPFYSSTIIGYYIPVNVSNAQIVVYDVNGQRLKMFNIADKGIGQLNISGGTLPSGTYMYSLFADGKKVDTKRLVLTK